MAPTPEPDSAAFRLQLGFWEGKATEPTSTDWEALVCEMNRFISMRLKKELQDNSIAAWATFIHWKYDPNRFLPCQVDFILAASYGNGTSISHHDAYRILQLNDVEVADFTGNYITTAVPLGENPFFYTDKVLFGSIPGESEDVVSSDEVLTKATCPVANAQGETTTILPLFTMRFAFFDGYKKEPTLEEVEALICETDTYFQKRLREQLRDPSITSHSTNINWVYDPSDFYSLKMNFTSSNLYGDGFFVKSDDVFNGMKSTDVPLFTEHYVVNAAPLEQNVFHFTEDIYFGGYLNQIPVESKIAGPVDCKAYLGREASFTLQIGFESRTGEPSQEEIAAMICQTNKYFTERLQKELQDDGVQSYATDISWSFTPGTVMPSVVNFTSHTTYGNGDLVPAKEVYSVMRKTDVPKLVSEYIWNSEPLNLNIYHDSLNVYFGGSMGSNHGPVKMDKVLCTDGIANKGGKKEKTTKMHPH